MTLQLLLFSKMLYFKGVCVYMGGERSSELSEWSKSDS
jgi:hypothetical protein